MAAVEQSPTRERPFAIRVERRSRAALVVLDGSCPMDVSPRLSDELLKLADEGLPLLVIDLAGLDFIDSSGLGAFVSAYLKFRRRHGIVRLVRPQPQIWELLETTRLTLLFPVFGSVDDALAAAQD